MLDKSISKMKKQELLDYIESMAEAAKTIDSLAQGVRKIDEEIKLTAQNADSRDNNASISAQNAEAQNQAANASAQNAEAQNQTAAKSAEGAENQSQAATKSAEGAETQSQAAAKSAEGAEAQNQAAITSAQGVKTQNQAAIELNAQIDNFLLEINDKNSGHKQFIEKTRNDITSLLPSAAATGLATAFRFSKLRYGNDPQEDTGLNKGLCATIRDKNFLVSLVLYSSFLALLLLSAALILATFGINFFWESVTADFNQQNIFGDKLSFLGMVGRITFLSPIFWVALHINRQINRRSQLYEAYNYRQRLMELYVGFSSRRDTSSAEDTKNLETLTDIIFENVKIPPGKADIHESDNLISNLIWTKRSKPNEPNPNILPAQTTELLKPD